MPKSHLSHQRGKKVSIPLSSPLLRRFDNYAIAILFAKGIKKPKQLEIRPLHKMMDADLNTVLDEGDAENGSQYSERMIINPQKMKLVEQTIRMLNLS